MPTRLELELWCAMSVSGHRPPEAGRSTPSPSAQAETHRPAAQSRCVYQMVRGLLGWRLCHGKPELAERDKRK